MKGIDYYMSLPYRMEIQPDLDEGGFAVRFPDLPGCISSGESIEEALKNAEDAKISWFSAAIEEGIDIAEPYSLKEYSGQFKLRIPRSLHRSLAEQAKEEGISMNQYCLFLLSRNHAADIR